MNAEITTLQKDVDRWSATHSVNSVRTRALMYRLLDAVKALAAAPPAASPASQPARCSAINNWQWVSDNAPGPFQCEGKHGHVGPHWWGSMTWTDAAPAPVEPPPAKGKE
jgi:hypothetical protein